MRRAPSLALLIVLAAPASVASAQAPDADEDGVPNVLELNGYDYDSSNGLTACDPAVDDPCSLTDYLEWSTDGDPFSDLAEVHGANIPVAAPYNHPLVAAEHIIGVNLVGYTVTPTATITDARGGSLSEAYENSTTTTHEESISGTATSAVGPGGMFGYSVTAAVTESTANTTGTTRTESVDWNTATTVDLNEAAVLWLQLFIRNDGSAQARNLRLRFALRIGTEDVASVRSPLITQLLAAETEWPLDGRPYVISNGVDDNPVPITLTMDQLKAVESGAPITMTLRDVLDLVADVTGPNEAARLGASRPRGRRCSGVAPYVARGPPPLAMRALIALLLLPASGAVAQPVGPPAAPEIWSEHFLYGYPTGTPITNDLVVRDLYALSSNDATRLADWAAYRLTVAEVAGVAESADLERRWRRDPWLDPGETLDPTPASADPYRNSGYDRGHLVPLASVVGSASAPTVNVYSAVVPQRPALNRGPWAAVEAAVRALVLRRAPRALDARPPGHDGFPTPDDRAAVWVVSGTLYEAPTDSLQTAVPHVVPSGFWTVVAVVEGWDAASVRASAFVFGQDGTFPDPLLHLTSVDEVEQRSGLDLFRLVPDAAEASLEGVADDAAGLFPDG